MRLGPWLVAGLLFSLPVRGLAFRGDGGALFRRGAALFRGVPHDPSTPGARARLEEAVAALEQALASSRGADEAQRVAAVLVPARRALARALARGGDPGAARASLVAAVRLASDDRQLRLEAAQAAAEAGDPRTALFELTRLAHQGHPGPFAARVAVEVGRLARALAAQGEARWLEDAARVLGAVSAGGLSDAQAVGLLAERGRVAFRRHRYLDALAAFDAGEARGALPPDAARERRMAAPLARREHREGSSAQDHGADFRLQASGAWAEGLAPGLLDLLQQARDEVGQRLEVFPGAPVAVRLLTSDEYSRALGHHGAGAAASNALVLRVVPGRAVAAYRSTVFHEYAHHAMRQAAGGVRPPRWFDEGLAMNLEPGRLPLVWYKLVLDAARQGRGVGLQDLASFQGGGDARVAYGAAALFVEALLERFGWGAMARCLARLGQGQDLEAAFLADTGLPLAEVHAWFLRDLLEQVRGRIRAARGGGPATAAATPGGEGPSFVVELLEAGGR